MVECKNALVESNGDFEAAKTRLRNSDDQDPEDPEEPDLVVYFELTDNVDLSNVFTRI